MTYLGGIVIRGGREVRGEMDELSASDIFTVLLTVLQQ